MKSLFNGGIVVGILNRHRTGRPSIPGSVSGRDKRFVFCPKRPDQLWGPAYRRLYGSKEVKEWPWPLRPSNAEIKNEWISTFIPAVPSWLAHGQPYFTVLFGVALRSRTCRTSVRHKSQRRMGWGWRVLCASVKWKRRVGVAMISCLSVASCVSSTTERFLLGDCPITTGNRSSLPPITLSTSSHQTGRQILCRWWRNLTAFSKGGAPGAGF
jgi:hypothetical protein